VVKIHGWDGEIKGEARAACKELGDLLEQLIREIEDVKKRKLTKKVLTCLRIYTPEFQQNLSTALQSFHVQMSVAGQKLSEELLESMMEQMNGLRITMKHLEETPGAEIAIAPIETRILDLGARMQEIKDTQTKIQESMVILIPDIVSRITDQLRSDGNETRDLLRSIRDQVGSNDSLTRISAEMSTALDSIKWYSETDEPKPPFKVWCLDDPEHNRPSADINGIAVSTTKSTETVDVMFTKRYAADDFDQNLSRAKRLRTKDVAPYVGVAKNQGYIHLLSKFIPPLLGRRLAEKISVPVLDAILKTINCLEQEYRYLLLDRILRMEIYEVPQVAIFESLERAMIATLADKLKATFKFAIYHTKGGFEYCSDLHLQLSR